MAGYSDTYSDVYDAGGAETYAGYLDGYQTITTVPVSAARATTWNVAAIAVLVSVSATRASSWNVGALGQASASRDTTWRVLKPVSSSRATSWSFGNKVSSTRTTRWATLADPTTNTTPGLRLRAFLPRGADQGVLPTPTDIQATFTLNEVGGLRVTYPKTGPKVEILGQPLEVAVELSPDGGRNWAEPPDGRFVISDDTADPVKTGGDYQANFKSYVQRFDKAKVYGHTVDPAPFQNLTNADGKREFQDKTPGSILTTLFNEAAARKSTVGDPGLAGITWSSFNAETDSAGQTWAFVLTIYYDPGLSYLSILQDMADKNMIDFRMQGRSLYVYNAGTVMRQDRTQGSTQVVFRAGRDVSEAPFRRTWENLADAAYFAGGDGEHVQITTAAALTPWGRQETFISDSRVTDVGTMIAWSQAVLAQSDRERTEYTRGIDFTRAASMPFFAYNVGDYVWDHVDGTQNPIRYRLRQMTLTCDNKGVVAGNVVLNDRFLEADIRAKRRIAGIMNGASSGNGGGGGSADGESEAGNPGKVTGLTGSSAAYLSEGGFVAAQVSLRWSALLTNADGSTIKDLDHYEIVRRESGTVNARMRASTTDTDWDDSPYRVASQWFFSVRAVDRTGHRGELSDELLVTMAQDTIPPQAPSTPVCTSRLGTVSVFWDGQPSFGAWPSDLDYIEVHYSNVNSFTPDAATLFDRLYGKGTSVITDQPYGVPLFVRLVAVDKSKLKSGPSVQATATPQRLVGTDLDPFAITYEQIGFKDPDNIVPDGSFETSQYRSRLTARSSAAWTFTQTDKYHGDWSAQINAATNPSTIRQLDLIPTVEAQQIQATSKLFCRMAYRAAAGATGNLSLVVQWILQDGTTTTSRITGATKNDLWQQIAQHLPAPSNVQDFRIYLELDATGTTGLYTVDAVEVRRTVGTILIEDAAINNAQINNLAVNSAKISDLSAGKITAGTLTADVLLGGRIMTSTSGNRVELSATGIRTFRGSTLVSHLNPATAQLQIFTQGDVTHTSTGHGLQLGVNDGINLVMDGNEIMARFAGSYSELYLNREGGTVNIGGKKGRYLPDLSDLGSVPMDDDHRINLDGAVYIRSWSDGGYADEFAPLTVGIRSATHLWFDSNEFGAANGDATSTLNIMPAHETNGNHTSLTIMASGAFALHRRDADSAVIRGYSGITATLWYYQSELRVTNSSLNGYQPIVASAFTLVSSADTKTDVEEVPDAMAIVKAAQGHRWRYREGEDQARIHYGPMADDLPMDMRHRIDDDVYGYDVASVSGLLWEAVRQLGDYSETVNDQLQTARAAIVNLRNRVQALEQA